MRTTVIFDTNAYRRLTEDLTFEETASLINRIKQKENALQITPCANRIVGMEMIARLIEGPQGLNFKGSLNGIYALALHCLNKDSNTFNLTPAPYANFARAAFQKEDDKHDQLSNILNIIFTKFRKAPFDAYQELQKDGNIESCAAYFETEERNFANMLKGMLEICRDIVKKDNPKIPENQFNSKLLPYIETKGKFTILYCILLDIANRIGHTVNDEQLNQKTAQIINTYPVAAGFYSYMLSKMVIGDIDIFSKKSRQTKWNWAWDYEVCCFISHTAIQTGKMLLVTADTDITKALKKDNLEHYVMTLPQYLKHIEIE